MTSGRKRPQPDNDRGSRATAALEEAWTKLRRHDPRIPSAVIVLIDAASRRRKKGYFLSSSWQHRGKSRVHEVAINPELFSSPRDLVATMLHEAVHAMLFEETGNAGVGSTDQYHTKVFQDRCEEMGLRCAFKDTRHGWNQTAWPDEEKTPRPYHSIVAMLKKSLPKGIEGRRSVWQPKKTPASGRQSLVCGCDPPRKIHVAKSMLQMADSIRCELCNQHFK